MPRRLFNLITLMLVLPVQQTLARPPALAALPVAAYTPETGVILGGYAQFVLASDSLCRASQVATWLTATQKRQAELGMKPEVWLADNTWSLGGELSYQNWPDTYHGIGPDSPEIALKYTVERVKLEGLVRHRLTPGLYGGVFAQHIRESFISQEPGIPHSNQNGPDTGIGAELSRDTRDNTIWPSRGVLQQFRAVRHGSWAGNAHQYSRWLTDLRGYRALGLGVMAGQVALEGRGGDPGFRALPKLGEYLRAVNDSRFIDRWLVAARLEWRQPLPFTIPTSLGEQLSRRSGLVLFVETGMVGPRGADLFNDPLKLSGGMGGRFALLPAERVNVCADLALWAEGVALRIKVGEEF